MSSDNIFLYIILAIVMGVLFFLAIVTIRRQNSTKKIDKINN